MVLQILVGMVVSQLCLVALWASCVGSWISRAIIVISGLSLTIGILGMIIRDFSLPTWLIPSATVLGLLAVLLILRRWNGTALRSLGDMARPSASSEEAIQFSIGQLMTITFFIAVALAVARAVKPFFPAVSDLSIVATFCGCFVCLDLAILWTALGSGSFWKRLWVPAIATILAFVVVSVGSLHRNWSILIGSQTVFVLISLWIVRRVGFRLLKTKLTTA